ncbi:MAG: HmuY family protein [Myxococcales bacterium]|nr:HmuY family protein [Myxococcales bacterium]
MDYALHAIARAALMLGATLALGCAAELGTSDGDEQDPPAAGGITTVDNGDGTYTTLVDASDGEAWLTFDFESGERVLEGDEAWDLGFQRFEIKSNGGISGDGRVVVAALAGADFEALERAPGGEYVEDAADGDDEDEDPDYAFLVGDGWYSYDPTDHTLSPQDVLYVVRTVEQGYFKLQMLDYYDEAGSSGFPRFLWAEVDAPAGDISVTEPGRTAAPDAGAP